MNLDILDCVKGIDFPDRSITNLAYNQAFEDAARQTYQAITGRSFPEDVKVE